ncbi:MAG TPA: hypothetical protein VN381_05935, partial [Anaerovoracaceae bacterium]|nr:hypothetical protein [Anaerovoracaceae bacterium]
NIDYFRRDKRGFLTVEAAIFLPLFIVGVLTFAYLIKFMSVEEAVFHSFTDEARVLSAEAGRSPLEVPFFVKQLDFEASLKDRVYDENGDNISTVDIDQFLYLYPIPGMTGMISMDLNYEVNVKLPIPFRKSLPVSESLMLRSFIGREEAADPLPFEEMEREKRSDPVWIFPRSGERYHGENCTYITSEPKQLIMSVQIRRNYEPCSICDSRGLPDGSLVYCFRTGGSYHTGECPLVDKYVVQIEKEAAVEKGYTACLKCGGN